MGVDFFVVNQGLRIFDPSCIRLNPLKVNNLHQGFKVLSSIVTGFSGMWERRKNGSWIYKAIMHNALRILELGRIIARRLHLTP